jgi:hypothetical protein
MVEGRRPLAKERGGHRGANGVVVRPYAATVAFPVVARLAGANGADSPTRKQIGLEQPSGVYVLRQKSRKRPYPSMPERTRPASAQDLKMRLS